MRIEMSAIRVLTLLDFSKQGDGPLGNQINQVGRCTAAYSGVWTLE